MSIEERSLPREGGGQHGVLEQCAVRKNEMQGAADRRAPEAADPLAGRDAPGSSKNFLFFGVGRCKATQQIDYPHKQCSALHVKDHPKRR